MSPIPEEDVIDIFAPALRAMPLPRQGAALRGRLFERIAESQQRHRGLQAIRHHASPWRPLMSGVRVRDLRTTENGASVLIELLAGASLPVHRHRYLEEGIVLDGRMQMDDLDLGPGDYHASFPGSKHARITSAQGCLTYLRGTSLGKLSDVLRELLGGLKPGRGSAPLTIKEGDGNWQSLGAGVEEKQLLTLPGQRSRFIRLAPESRLETLHLPAGAEYMVIQGEAFFGDLLLRSHEMLLATTEDKHPLSSDGGGLLFIHEKA